MLRFIVSILWSGYNTDLMKISLIKDFFLYCRILFIHLFMFKYFPEIRNLFVFFEAFFRIDPNLKWLILENTILDCALLLNHQ